MDAETNTFIETSETTPTKNKATPKKMKKNKDPMLRNRKAGQSRTILLYPLHNSIEETEIEEFVKRAALSAPLRIDLLKFQSNDTENEDTDIVHSDDTTCNAYAYCTFTSSADCWLVRKHLNYKQLKGHRVSITFSTVPRMDLEGLTNIIEFSTNYPPITDKKSITQFLNSYPQNDTISEDDFALIRNPKSITSPPGHNNLKGKWLITYDSPETATKALEFYSGRYYFDTENNKKRFVVICYQMDRNKRFLDRQECFYGITDRVILRNIPRNMTDDDDILLFLQSNGFDVHKHVKDVNIVHQMVEIAEKHYNQRKKKRNKKFFKPKTFKPWAGFAIVTFANYELANKAYTNLNGKQIVDGHVMTTGFESPAMTDPLKKILKGETNTVHLSNFAWDVTEEQMKEWLSTAAKMYVSGNKHLIKKEEGKEDEGEKGKKEENPFIYTDTEAGKYCTRPLTVYIKYRNGYSTCRANATFATNEEASIVVEMLNERKLGKRKIKLNWALPITDYKFRAKRRMVMSRKHNPQGKKGKKDKKHTKHKKVRGINRNEDDSTGKKLESNKTNRGTKRRQTFKKPSTKKIKLTL